MTEQRVKCRDKITMRVRKLSSVQVDEIIKERLSGKSVSHVLFEGKGDDNLVEIKKKMKPSEGCNLQIRNNKIYEIRRRPRRNEIIIKAIKETIKILSEKGLINTKSPEEDIYRSVMNTFIGGNEKKIFRIIKI